MPGAARSALVVLVALAVATPAFAQEEPATFAPEDIVFPVVGEVTYIDDFGAPRGDHTHEGIDIMSVGEVKGLDVVAAADGVVGWIGAECCYLSIDHGGGWETWYIHLNNDTPGTDDGLGWGIAEGIEVGTAVTAGSLIGWLGDSGNAEETPPHLHFEIRMDGVAINPYPYLLAAQGLAAPLGGDYFTDDDGSVHEADIDRLFELGITKGCNPPANDQYCPDRQITRGEMAAFIRRLRGLPSVDQDFFVDDAGNIFEDDIDALTAAGIGFGCGETEFCPDTPLLRDEMAELLVRTFGYENPDGTDFFVDDEDNRFEDSINALATSGITVGCNPPDNDRFCPARPLSRAEMASFFIRALGA